MRGAILALSISLAAVTTALPAPSAPVPTSPRAVLANPGTPTVTLVALPGGASLLSGVGAAVADLGTVSSNVHYTNPGVRIVRRPQSYVVVTTIGLRATAGAGIAALSLQAFVNAEFAGVVVRIDGVELAAVPRVFAAHVPPNVVTRHQVEIEIPNAMNPAAVPSEIPLEFGAVAAQ